MRAFIRIAVYVVGLTLGASGSATASAQGSVNNIRSADSMRTGPIHPRELLSPADKLDRAAPSVEKRTAIKLADFDATKLTKVSIIDDFKTDIPPRNLPGFGVVKWTTIVTFMEK